jgi:hypothetical protein
VTDPREPEEPVDPVGDEEDEEVRALLRGLPDVAPPEGFFDHLIRRRRRRARTVAGAALVAAGVTGAIVVAQATGITGDVSPPMSALADFHSEAAVVESSMQGDPDGDVPAPYQAPEHVAGMSRGFTFRHPDDVVQVLYGEDGHYLSVFEQAGDLEDEATDAGLTPLDVAGVDAWRSDAGAVIVRRDGVVYVLMGDFDVDQLASIVDDLPDGRPMGLTRRIGDAMDDLVDAFGLG